MRYDVLKRDRGYQISTTIEEYFAAKGVKLEPMSFDLNDENWSLEERVMLLTWVHLNTDADGCYIRDDGNCISPHRCPHSAVDDYFFEGAPPPAPQPEIKMSVTPVDEGSLFGCEVVRNVSADLPADAIGEMVVEAMQNARATGRDPAKLRSLVITFPKG